MDVTPQTLTTPVKGGNASIMFKKNQKIPFRVTKQFTTTVDNQTEMQCEVYEGELLGPG